MKVRRQKYLFSKLARNQLRSFFEAKQKTILAFDLDGTLIPISKTFSEVFLDSKIRGKIKSLAELTDIAIVSGRSLANLKKIVGLKNVVYIGNHGLEGIRNYSHLVDLRTWQKEFTVALGDTPGVEIENKKLSISIHFRKTKNRERVRKKVQAVAQTLIPKVRLIGGKAIINVLPTLPVNKGTALLAIMKKKRKSKAFFVGDDQTDEDVFEMNRTNIFSVRVGLSKKSYAPYYLKSQNQITELLDQLISFYSI
jgi:trehalose 6-phosphate phosphatase